MQFLLGEGGIFFVWMGCYHMGEDIDNFLNIFIKTIGEDSNVEDGVKWKPDRS
jgi:hypothetical protein